MLEERDDRSYLGFHTAFGEMPFGEVLFRLVDGHTIQPTLIRFAVIQGNFFYGSGYQQQIGMDVDGQYR